MSGPLRPTAGTPIGPRGWILELLPGQEAADSWFVVTSRAG
ncbi:MAG: hypothetical protein VB093_10890 [Propionicimonas sp.]|nr:hypothetical protein [Propionicimonas sp.]